MGKASVGFGAVAGIANVALYKEELALQSDEYSKVQTGTTLNAAAGVLSIGAVGAAVLAAPVALTLLTVGAVGLTGASLLSGTDTVEVTLNKLKGVLGESPTEAQLQQVINPANL